MLTRKPTKLTPEPKITKITIRAHCTQDQKVLICNTLRPFQTFGPFGDDGIEFVFESDKPGPILDRIKEILSR